MQPSTLNLLAPIYISLILSAATVISAVLMVAALPILWTFPAVFIPTVVHHVTFLLMLRCEPRRRERLFSTTSETVAFALTSAWLSAVGISVALVAIIYTGRILDGKHENWIVIVLVAFSFLETTLMAIITIFVRKERKFIAYRTKWEWRTNMTSSQWRYVGLVHLVHSLMLAFSITLQS